MLCNVGLKNEKHAETSSLNIYKQMIASMRKKQNKIIVLSLYIILLCVLLMVFWYYELHKLGYVIFMLGPLLWIAVVKKMSHRIIGLFVSWALLIISISYFTSKFARIIVIYNEKNYKIEKVFIGSKYEYRDSENNLNSLVVEGNYIFNQTDNSLRLYQVVYSKYRPLSCDSGEHDIMEILPHSIERIYIIPDYILKSPPNKIWVEKHGNNSDDRNIVKTVLKMVGY